ncbi:MAG: lysophospholipid acyltransferase family protein [Verrucomicrobia bacterium]|nr:lysophospholipid acyltransferase family protein [Verrucomicrobiota bacterium]
MNYWLFRAAAFASRIVPRRVAYAVARLLVGPFLLIKRREARALAANLQRVRAFRGQPTDAATARRLARRVYVNFAKYIVDYYRYAEGHDEELSRLMEVDNIQALSRGLALGRGVVVVTAHLGNIENGGMTIVRRGYKFTVVALRQTDPRTNALFQRQRRARGMQVIEAGHGARDCLRTLQRNEIVAVVGDRDFSPNRDTMSFFGAPARIPIGFARLALATGAPVVPGFCVRLPGDRYRLFFYDPIFVDREKDTVESICRRVVPFLERAIGDHADQWYCFHNLWNIEEDWVLMQRFMRRG